jgi:hypothetical protein
LENSQQDFKDWEGAMVEPLGRISYVSTLMPNHVPYLDLIWSRGIFTMPMLIPMPYPLIMSPSGSTLLSTTPLRGTPKFEL